MQKIKTDSALPNRYSDISKLADGLFRANIFDFVLSLILIGLYGYIFYLYLVFVINYDQKVKEGYVFVITKQYGMVVLGLCGFKLFFKIFSAWFSFGQIKQDRDLRGAIESIANDLMSDMIGGLDQPILSAENTV